MTKIKYQIVDNVSVITDKNGVFEEFKITSDLEIKSIVALVNLYGGDKLSREELIQKLNPTLGDELIGKTLEEKKAYYDSLDRIRKNKRLHDALEEIEIDSDGKCYLANHNWVIPDSIVDRLLDAKFNPNSKYTVESLILFLKQLMLCPNKNVRDNAILYIERNGMFITKNGMLLTFRRANKSSSNFNGNLESIYNKVKTWKKSPKNYTIFENNGVLIHKVNCNDLFIEKNGEVYNNIGNLNTLYQSYKEDNNKPNTYHPTYKDNTTFFIDGEKNFGSPYYMLGKETRLPRSYTDESDNTCSTGLHSWAKEDYLSYRGFGDTILAILISPIDFVSSPYGDHSKMRSAAIYPIFEVKEHELKDFDESSIGNIDLNYFKYTLEYIEEQFKLSKENREININSELTESELLRNLTEIEDLVKNRVVKV